MIQEIVQSTDKGRIMRSRDDFYITKIASDGLL